MILVVLKLFLGRLLRESLEEVRITRRKMEEEDMVKNGMEEKLSLQHLMLPRSVLYMLLAWS